MDEGDNGWLEPDDDMGVWEHQGKPLTVHALRSALSGLDHDVPVQVAYFDGAQSRTLRPMHIDLRGQAGTPSAVIVTVT